MGDVERPKATYVTDFVEIMRQVTGIVFTVNPADYSAKKTSGEDGAAGTWYDALGITFLEDHFKDLAFIYYDTYDKTKAIEKIKGLIQNYKDAQLYCIKELPEYTDDILKSIPPKVIVDYKNFKSIFKKINEAINWRLSHKDYEEDKRIEMRNYLLNDVLIKNYDHKYMLNVLEKKFPFKLQSSRKESGEFMKYSGKFIKEYINLNIPVLKFTDLRENFEKVDVNSLENFVFVLKIKKKIERKWSDVLLRRPVLPSYEDVDCKYEGSVVDLCKIYFKALDGREDVYTKNCNEEIQYYINKDPVEGGKTRRITKRVKKTRKLRLRRKATLGKKARGKVFQRSAFKHSTDF